MTDAAKPDDDAKPKDDTQPKGDAKPAATPEAPVAQLVDQSPLANLPPWVVGVGVLLLVLGLVFGRLSAPSAKRDGPAAADASAVWTCSMHPNIQLPTFGQCPICGMDLIPLADGADPGPRALELSEAAAALAEVEVRPAERRAVSREVRMVGKVHYDETRLKFITAWIPGRLDRLFVDYTGTLVGKGDHLMNIYSPQLLTAQEELLQALAARRELINASPLLLETAEATVASSREKLRLWGLSPEQIKAIETTGKVADHVTVHAPIGGIVVEKTKNEGDYVKTGERVFAIADLSRLWIKLDAYESDLGWVRIGQDVSFEVEAFPGETFKGKVVFVDPALDAVSHTVKVRLNVENHDRRLKPEMFVRAVLRSPLGTGGQTLDPSLAGKWICPMHWEVIKDVQGGCDECGMALVPAETLHRAGDSSAELPLVVPATAVLWTGTRSLVYVRRPGEAPVFEGRIVVLGPRAGDVYVVREGLEEGERVVTHGAFKIDSALQIKAKPSMMLPAGEGAVSSVAVPASFRSQLAPVTRAYLRLQRALAADDLAKAQAASGLLEDALSQAKRAGLSEEALRAWAPLAKQLRDAAQAGAKAADLDAARRAFHSLSQGALNLVHRFGVPGQAPLAEAFCPMAREKKGASWLQVGTEINNPYFGSSMLRCGEVREIFAVKKEEPKQEEPKQEEPKQEEPKQEEPKQEEPKPTKSSFRQQLGTFFASYLRLQEALAGDDAQAAAKHGHALREGLQAIDGSPSDAGERALWEAKRPALERAVAIGGDIAVLRVAFDGLSQALIPLVEQLRPGPKVHRMHCPMAFKNRGADWLQVSETLANPYYGKRMLRCGKRVAVITPAESPGGGR